MVTDKKILEIYPQNLKQNAKMKKTVFHINEPVWYTYKILF